MQILLQVGRISGIHPFFFWSYHDKMKIIQDWLESKKVKNIQFFLGFANFYHQFIFNYLDIVILLIYLI